MNKYIKPQTIIIAVQPARLMAGSLTPDGIGPNPSTPGINNGSRRRYWDDDDED